MFDGSRRFEIRDYVCPNCSRQLSLLRYGFDGCGGIGRLYGCEGCRKVYEQVTYIPAHGEEKYGEALFTLDDYRRAVSPAG